MQANAIKALFLWLLWLFMVLSVCDYLWCFLSTHLPIHWEMYYSDTRNKIVTKLTGMIYQWIALAEKSCVMVYCLWDVSASNQIFYYYKYSSNLNDLHYYFFNRCESSEDIMCMPNQDSSSHTDEYLHPFQYIC